MKRLPGRPTKKEAEKVVKRRVSFSPENYKYIINILDERKWESSGFFSKVLGEIIADHIKVRRFKEKQSEKLKGQLEMLE